MAQRHAKRHTKITKLTAKTEPAAYASVVLVGIPVGNRSWRTVTKTSGYADTAPLVFVYDRRAQAETSVAEPYATVVDALRLNERNCD